MAQLEGIFAGAADQLAEAAKIIKDRNAVYGDSVNAHAQVMAALFPDGVALNGPLSFARFSLVNMVVIKLTRYCTDPERPHRDSLSDAIAYLGALAQVDESNAS